MRLRTSMSAFSSSRRVAVRMETTCWRMVSRSSRNSTSSLPTSTSVIWCERRTIFSRLMRIPCSVLESLREPEDARANCRRLAQNQLAVPRQLLLHFLVHLLIRDAEPPHVVLALDKNLPDFFIEAILDGEFLEHALPNPLRDGFGGLRFNVLASMRRFTTSDAMCATKSRCRSIPVRSLD